MSRWFGRPAAPASVTRSEAYRVLRTNLDVALMDIERPVLFVTSAESGEGKTSVTAQLARAFADIGRRVFVIDLDLRDPDLHVWFDIDNIRGFTDVVSERCRLEDALHYVDLPTTNGARTRRIYTLTAGSHVSNATELLGSARSARLLDRLGAEADVVLIDTAPVLPVADTLVVARFATGCILVVGDQTPVETARAAKDALVRNHARVFGVVLNRFDDARAGGGYRYGYGYGLESPSDVGSGER